MSDREVGRIAALFRYPVKSMKGDAMQSVEAGWHGFAGDRRWAFVRDGMVRSGFPWMTIREKSDLWHYHPRFVEADTPDTSPISVRTPSGQELDVDDPALAAEIGDGVRVIKQDRGVFDTFPLSVISIQTVSALGAYVGNELDIRRFRPNLVVAASDGADFPEDNWIGSVLRVGGMRMRIDKRDKRCVTINVDPETAARDSRVLRAVAQERQACLGVYGSTVTPGIVSVGDGVFVE